MPSHDIDEEYFSCVEEEDLPSSMESRNISKSSAQILDVYSDSVDHVSSRKFPLPCSHGVFRSNLESALNTANSRNRSDYVKGVTEDVNRPATNFLGSGSSQLFVGGLGIVEDSHPHPFNLLRPALEPDPPPPPDPPDIEIFAVVGLMQSNSNQAGDGEKGQVERINRQREKQTDAKIDPDPPPPPDTVDLPSQACGQLEEETFTSVRAQTETHVFPAICFLPCSLSVDAIYHVHARSSAHGTDLLNAPLTTRSINALPWLGPADSFPGDFVIGTPAHSTVLSTDHDHATLPHAQHSDSLCDKAFTATKNLNLILTRSTAHTHGTFSNFWNKRVAHDHDYAVSIFRNPTSLLHCNCPFRKTAVMKLKRAKSFYARVTVSKFDLRLIQSVKFIQNPIHGLAFLLYCI